MDRSTTRRDRPDAAGTLLPIDGALAPGTRIGRYEILSKIAAGGMATVYLGRAHGAAGFERKVALKICHAHLQADADAAERFLAEARLAARIHHPNVVATLDVVEAPSLCIVMDFVEGASLGALISAVRKRDQKIPPAIVLRLGIDLLAGLHAAHELRDDAGRPLGLIHRDVTPQNILVGSDGITRIADFGILKHTGQRTLTQVGSVRGKLPYLAPEQLEAGRITRQVDVYAAGVGLWESLAAERLFKADSEAELAEKIRSSPLPVLAQRVPALSPALTQTIERALQRDPALRFPTAGAFADALESLGEPIATARDVASWMAELLQPLDGSEATAPGTTVLLPTTPLEPAPAGRTRRRTIGLSLAALVALALAAAVATRGPSASPPTPPTAVLPLPAPAAPQAPVVAPSPAPQPISTPQHLSEPSPVPSPIRAPAPHKHKSHREHHPSKPARYDPDTL